LAIEHARLHHETRRSERQARALHEAARAIGGELDFQERLGRVLDAALALLGVCQAQLALLDAQRGEIELAAARGGRPVAVGARLPLGVGLIGAVVAHNRPLRSRDAQADPRVARPDIVCAEGTRAWLGVPLADERGAFGALIALSDEPDAFTDEHERLLQAFAALASGAVREARLYAQAQAEVAERRRAEQEVRRAEAQYRALVERLPATA